MRYKYPLLTTLVLIFTFFLVRTSYGFDKVSRTFSLPENAKRINENLYYLGHAKDISGQDVEGYAIIRHRDAEVRSAVKNRSGGPTCYGFLASGAKWKSVEPWVVNTSNSSSLAQQFIFDNINLDINKWNSAASKTVLGNGSRTDSVLSADVSSPDGVNEAYFADVTNSNAIAVTTVWGRFSGPPQSRELVEWDQVYDDVDYNWSSNGEAGKMDFENIATHELGHAFGMDDIYDLSCSSVTMYGYADYGETNKQSLEQPDVNGVKALYR